MTHMKNMKRTYYYSAWTLRVVDAGRERIIRFRMPRGSDAGALRMRISQIYRTRGISADARFSVTGTCGLNKTLITLEGQCLS